MNDTTVTSATRLHTTLGRRTVRILDWLSLVVWALVAVVGVMQARQYNGGWLTSYGGDVFGPIAFWWGLRRTVFASPKAGAEIAALTQLAGCITWEFSQRFDLSNTPLFFTKGVFDPYDLVAYTITLCGCYVLDKTLQFRRRSRSAGENESATSNVA